MKKLITATIMFILLCCNTLHAQTYLFGEEQHRYMLATNATYRYTYASNNTNFSKYYITVGNYSKALDLLEKATNDCNYGPAFAILGQCYELGIGVERDLEIADEYYEYGAYNLDDLECQRNIRRIEKYGHWSASYRATYLKKLKNSVKVNTIPSDGGYGGYVGGSTINNNNSSSSSSSSTCRICGGSGTCTSCHGQGGSWQDTGYYTGSGNKSWINCPSCNGSKRCFNCHGTGRQ